MIVLTMVNVEKQPKLLGKDTRDIIVTVLLNTSKRNFRKSMNRFTSSCDFNQSHAKTTLTLYHTILTFNDPPKKEA